MSIRMEAYRKFQTWVVEPLLLPRWMSDARIEEEKTEGIRKAKLSPKIPGKARAWFHAASVGELESLTPVIEAWIQEGSEAIITVLSESARGSVRKLRSLEGPGMVLYAGYSPWEGHWREVLAAAQADVFVTAKYEAWPELWASLAALNTPILIVSAKARRSLRLAGTLCKVLGGQVPQLTLLTVRDEDSSELKSLFGSLGGVKVKSAGEPRWDRVSARAQQGSARAKALIERFKRLPRPWGVLAQVWAEDMEVWRGQLGRSKGTLWIVPHRVDSENVAKIELYLEKAGLSFQKTSVEAKTDAESNGRVQCILVDEIGVLLELYSATDWVYVGGGFGVSMHSTIEPALYGVPVSCGPSGEGQFPEIGELLATGQLTVVRDSEALGNWLEQLEQIDDAQRSKWRSQADGRLGATRQVLDAIRSVIMLPSTSR